MASFGAKTFCIEVSVLFAGCSRVAASTKERAPVSENIYPLFASHFTIAHKHTSTYHTRKLAHSTLWRLIIGGHSATLLGMF